MAQIPNLVPTSVVTDVDLLVTRQSGVDKNFTLLVMKNYLGVPAVGITPYMGTVLDDSTDVAARATLGVTRATPPEAIAGVSTTATMSPSTTKESIFTHAVPAGSPVPWPTSSVPSGWAECNGDAFVLLDFPQLALAYPSGVLPDLRGEFIRGWDNGRGVDTGRTVYSSQGDAIRNIVSDTPSNITTADSGAGGVSGAIEMLNTGGGASTPAGASTDKSFNFDASRVVPTADENRPRNVSFMYIVRLA